MYVIVVVIFCNTKCTSTSNQIPNVYMKFKKTEAVEKGSEIVQWRLVRLYVHIAIAIEVNAHTIAKAFIMKKWRYMEAPWSFQSVPLVYAWTI